APAPAGPAGDVVSAVPALQAFVERERGLAFKAPVDVTALDDAAFEARLTESNEEDDKEVRDAEAVLEAMGLLDPEVDLLSTVKRFSAGAVVGFYDTETDELVVRGSEATASVRSTLVHELTHAVEDQHFDLHRPDLGDEAFLGFQALAEGSAVRVEERYRGTLSSDERRQAARDEAVRAAQVPSNLPEVVQIAFAFPYSFGPRLVAALVRAGGQARLDAAYARPPASTEQVLEPERYLRGDEPRQVPVPRADAPAFDDGEIGQLFLVLMLDAELDDDEATAAADGWGGDRYVAWKDGARTCVRANFVMDTPRDTARLTDALARWAAERGPRASASGTSVTTCA
ncbi:MAG: hypothetical protein M3Q48_08630, partial [Actinomycetota bacterium]|nr:hypothetical protein [Actinomycetota bacterium]